MLLYKSLQSRIMAALVFVTLFSIIGLGLVAYWRERDALQNQLSLELTSSVNYTKQRLQDWLHERQSDVRFLAANTSNQESFLQILTADATAETEQFHRARLTASLLSMQQARPEYRRMLMADAQGKVLVADDPRLIGQSVQGSLAFTATLTLAPSALQQGYIADISYDEKLGIYVMCFGYPLLAPAETLLDSASVAAAALGVVLITVDIQKTVYPILTEWRTGQSGTAILSRAEGEETRILNPVLGDDMRPLTRFIPSPPDPLQARPAYWAARGAEGGRLTTDHLGVEVLTVYRYLPTMKWGLVLKMDTSEVFAPLHELIWHVTVIALGVLLIAFLVSIGIARTLIKPLAELVTTARAVTIGATPVYTALHRQDEIGILARSFREMVEALQRQQQQLKAANEVAGGILGARPIDELLNDIVQAAQRLTNARTAQITLHEAPNEDSANLRPRATAVEAAQLPFSRAPITALSTTNGIDVHAGPTNGKQHSKAFTFPFSQTADLMPPMLHRFDQQESLTIPIRGLDCDFGTLYVQKATAHSFTPADNDTLQALTTYAAVALENVRLVHRLQKWNAVLGKKVEERTKKLEEANQRLLVLDKMKSDLLYSISHELRNPISNLKLQIDLLHYHIESPRRQKYLTAMAKQVNMLAQLITDMLELIQLDGMHHQLVFTTLNLAAIVADVVKSCTVLMQESPKALTLDFAYPTAPLYVCGEQKQLTLAVTHLLRNAINFTQKGEIKVTIELAAEEVCLRIQDTGIGIAEADLPHIFERFFRGANVTQSTLAGSGLGLSVVEKIVALHRGRLDVTSHLGQGSTFRLWLPAQAAPNSSDL